MKLKFERLALKHKNKFVEIINDSIVLKFVKTHPNQYTNSNFDKFVNRLKNTKDEYSFAIINSGKMIGLIEIFKMKNKKAEIGFWIGSKHQRMGVATKALKFIKNFAKEHKIKELYADTMPKNVGSVNLLEKSGFHLHKKVSSKSCIYRLKIAQ